MKVKKIIAMAVSGLLAISAMAFSVSAADSVNVVFKLRECKDWANTFESSTLTISDNGDYSMTIKDSKDYDLFCEVKVDDKDGVKAPESFKNAVLTVKSITINDSIPCTFTETDIPFVNDSTGVVNAEFMNAWYAPSMRVSNVVKNGEGYNFTDSSGDVVAVKSMKIDFSISGIGSAEAASDESAEPVAVTEAEPVAVVEEDFEIADDSVIIDDIAPISETTEATPEAESAPAPSADKTTTAAKTGNTTSAVIVSVLAIAGSAALISKKRK